MKVYLYLSENYDLIITHQKPPQQAEYHAIEYHPYEKCRKRVVSTEELVNAEVAALGIASALREERKRREANVSMIYRN